MAKVSTNKLPDFGTTCLTDDTITNNTSDKKESGFVAGQNIVANEFNTYFKMFTNAINALVNVAYDSSLSQTTIYATTDSDGWTTYFSKYFQYTLQTVGNTTIPIYLEKGQAKQCSNVRATRLSTIKDKQAYLLSSDNEGEISILTSKIGSDYIPVCYQSQSIQSCLGIKLPIGPIGLHTKKTITKTSKTGIFNFSDLTSDTYLALIQIRFNDSSSYPTTTLTGYVEEGKLVGNIPFTRMIGTTLLTGTQYMLTTSGSNVYLYKLQSNNYVLDTTTCSISITALVSLL